MLSAPMNRVLTSIFLLPEFARLSCSTLYLKKLPRRINSSRVSQRFSLLVKIVEGI